MTKMTAKEIVDYVVNYYSPDPARLRSTSCDGGCMYNNIDGKHCAFALCCKPEMVCHLKENKVAGYHTDDNMSLDYLLREEFHGYNYEFWNGIQLIHDLDYNWDEYGLSERGREYADSIVSRYS